MKKIIIAVLVFLLCGTFFIGCGNAQDVGDAQVNADRNEQSIFDKNIIAGKDSVDDSTQSDKTDANSGMFSEGRLYFHVSKREALLVDSKGSLTWIYSEAEGFFEGFDSGDYVKIEHGFVMESYPGQTYASAIELIEDGDIYSFTDEEWERLSWVFTEPPER